MSGTARALIVEDDASWQQILTELLTDMGLAVDLAADATAARDALRTAAHQLAVVDLSLGGVDHHNQDGVLVLDAVRRHDPGCAAILLTGFATVEIAVSALTEHGAYTCLRKETFRRADFRTLVREALASAAAQAAARSAADTQTPSSAPPLAEARPVLVVEDEAGWRDILVEIVSGMGLRVRPAASYGEALGLLRRQRPDLAIVDLHLASASGGPGSADGYRLLAGTRAAAIPTIVVSGTAAPDDIERAYTDFGIITYIEKQAFDRRAFMWAVANALPPATATQDATSALTVREREVLSLLARGLTNQQIATTLVISVNTVKRHLKAVFSKLGVSTRAAAVAKATRRQ